jgi:3',5'-cyclic AMP phosphodiesterase CpdA
MGTNRRQFLILAGMAGMGMAGVGKLLSDNLGNSNSVSAIPLPKSKLLQRLAIVADTGTGSRQQYEVGRALARYHQQNPFDTVLLAGDNIYTNGEFTKIKSVFTLPYQDLLSRGVKFYACLGNHDVREDNGDRQVVYPEFNMQGKRYYTHGKGDVRFFVLETNALSNPNAPDRLEQLEWLDRELAASKAKWKIVYGHHAIYTAGVYHDNPNTLEMQRLVTPILKKHNIKLWINGHDHNYQRSKPIDGTTYVVCGGGGAGLYPVKAQSWTAFAQSTHSFGIVEVYQDQIILTGIDSYSRILDRGVVMA